MSIVRDAIADGIDPLDLEELREACLERCAHAAESRNLYLSHAMENLRLYEAFEPAPEEIAGELGVEQMGDWRAIAQLAAFHATRGHLEAQVHADSDKLRGAFAEAANHGFEVRGVHPSCVHGWAPHAREADWETGTLFEWPRLEGGDDAFLLRVGLSDRDAVWADLRRVGPEGREGGST